MDQKNSLKIRILSNIAVTEPFFVLVGLVNWKDEKELNLFIEVLLELIQEDYLICHTWDQENVESPLNGNYERIREYVKQRLEKGEMLNEVPDEKEYEFELSRKGASWLEEQLGRLG